MNRTYLQVLDTAHNLHLTRRTSCPGPFDIVGIKTYPIGHLDIVGIEKYPAGHFDIVGIKTYTPVMGAHTQRR